MHEFWVSATGQLAVRAVEHGRALARDAVAARPAGPLLLSGADQLTVASLAVWAVTEGHAVVVRPADAAPQEPGAQMAVDGSGAFGGRDGTHPGWQVAMYTSGSTGAPRPFGFTRSQLDVLAGWYTKIYRITGDSVVVTHLPVTYNFTFVAGLWLAASLGARLHFADSPASVFADAVSLAGRHDRCVVLANPVLLAAPPTFRLPDNVLVDSGGAPLSTTAIAYYRERVADLREGYGLTETGSLTHFDVEASPESLGTVGRTMPGVRTTIVDVDGRPRVVVDTPALGRPLVEPDPGVGGPWLTGDVGVVDAAYRLRVLGRADDHPVGGLWPREILDAIGTVLGSDCALVRHPDPASVRIRLRRQLPDTTVAELRAQVVEVAGIDRSAVIVDVAAGRLLHSHKLPRPTS